MGLNKTMTSRNDTTHTLLVKARPGDLKVRDRRNDGSCGICSRVVGIRNRRCDCNDEASLHRNKRTRLEMETSQVNIADDDINKYAFMGHTDDEIRELDEFLEGVNFDDPPSTVCTDEVFQEYSARQPVYKVPDTPEVRADIARIVAMGSGGFVHQAERLITSPIESDMLLWKGKLQMVLDNFSEMRATLSMDPKVYRLLESLFLHALSLSQCASLGGYLSNVATFCHSLLPADTSITTLFTENFENFEQRLVHQVELEVDMVSSVRMLYGCWKSAVKGPFFKHFSKGLSLAISLGVLSLDKVKEGAFSRCVDEKFLETLKKQQESSIDLFDAIFSTLVTVLETGVACYTEGNLLPILWSNSENKSMDNQYITLCNQWMYVSRGAYEEWKIGPLTRITFQRDLEKTLTAYRDYYSRTSDPFLRRHIETKILRLAGIETDFLGLIHNPERIAPLMVSLWGPSGTGKSTIVSTLFRTCDFARGITTGPDDFTVVKSGKYMEGCTEATRCILDDDIANKKGDKDRSEHSHVDRIIGIKNNAPFYYPKAAVEAKDKTRCLAEYYFTTGNTQDFRAAEYSNCPHSIQSRPDILVEFTIKPEVRVDGGTGLDKAKVARYEKQYGRDSHILFSVTEAVAHEGGDLTSLSTYRPVVWNHSGGPVVLTNVGVATFKAYMCEVCIKHFAHQEELLSKKESYLDEIEHCSTEGCKYPKGSCPVHDHFGPGEEACSAEQPASMLPCPNCSKELIIYPNVEEGNCPGCRKTFITVRTTNLETLEKQSEGIQHQSRTIIQAEPAQAVRIPDIIPQHTREYLRELKNILDDPGMTLEHERATYIDMILFYNFIAPYTWDVSDYLSPWLTPVIYARLHKYFVSSMYICMCLCFVSLFIDLYVSCFLFFLGIFQLLYARAACKMLARVLINRSMHRIPEVMALAKRAAVGVGICAGLYTLGVTLRMGYRASVSLRYQGTTPVEESDHEKALKRASRKSTYYQVRKTPLRRTELSRTTSESEHLIRRIYENTARASFKYLDAGGKMVSAEGQILMLSNHWMLLPTHYLEVTRGNASAILRVDDTGLSFEVRLDKLNTCVVIGDISLAWVSENGSKFHNLTGYLLKEMPVYDRNTAFDMAYCAAYFTRDYTEKRVTGNATLGNTHMVGKEYLSMFDKHRKEPTAEGMCGAPMVSTHSGFSIVGLHSCGRGHEAVFAVFSAKEVEKAMDKIQENLVIPLSCPDSGVVSNGRFGITLLKEDELHPKSPINYQKGTSIQYHGSIVGRSTPKSVMVDTMCRSLVEERFRYIGLEPLMAPEINPHWKPWQSWLAKAGEPSHSVPYEHMIQAYNDWKEPLIDIIRNGPKEVTDLLHVLTDEELANGRCDNTLIRPLNFKSVVGGMLTGSKESYCTTYEKDGKLMRMFNDTVEDQRKSDESKLQNLERCNVIIKGLLKLNEANTKPKCRVLTGWSAADTMNIRRVCAGPAALMQMYPFISECMVGLDRHLDWFELREFLKEDLGNILGGDYSSWDAKMCSMVTYFAYSYFIEAGMEMNYDEKYINQLISLREEVVYPYVALSGDLISLNSGTHASGNAITVHINCIANSLLIRCAYYGSGHTGRFRDKVKLATYGDDFNGSTEDKTFTNNVIREYCGEYGTIVTSSDKKSVMKDWMEKLDFLKTKTSHNLDLATTENPRGIYGAADIDSILKPLRMRAIDSELNNKDHCATVFSDAAYELVFHGKTVFDDMVPILIDIAKDLGFYERTTFLQCEYSVLVDKILLAIEQRQ